MNSFLSYLGGKSKLVDRIVARIPAHICYCEVFSGAAWLLFRKDLVTLYRVLKYHLDEFIRYLRFILISREEFDRFKQTPPDVLTDIQRKDIFNREDFNRLRVILGGIKGKFILSINDVPEIRDIYKGFKIESVTTIYTAMKAGKKKPARELLIRNF